MNDLDNKKSNNLNNIQIALIDSQQNTMDDDNDDSEVLNFRISHLPYLIFFLSFNSYD